MDNIEENSKPWGWVGTPFKLSFCTYSTYKYKEHPIKEKYANFKTLEDLHKGLSCRQIKIDSPTACYFNEDSSARDFYHDEQDCVIWYYNEDGSIVTDSGLTVAKSLPEFLSHINDDSDRFYESVRNKTFFNR